MSSPTPVQSFLGGVGLALPVHLLMRLNGSVFGVSGFIHGAVRGNTEVLSAASGLVVGGVVVGLLESNRPPPMLVDLPWTLLSGLLVGLGTKMSKGCTSGHMLSGLSRLSLRSLAATVAFFITGTATANLTHGDLPAAQTFDWSLGMYGKALLFLQAILFVAISSSFWLVPADAEPEAARIPLNGTSAPQLTPFHKSFRYLTSFMCSIEFALALRLSNLVDPLRVISFLLLPLHRAFDPSLAFLAIGALPLTILLCHCNHGSEKPHIGGEWSIPQDGAIDVKLLVGASIFGVGWGLSGICPGPGLVNLGRAIVAGTGLLPTIGWVTGVAVGGLMA